MRRAMLTVFATVVVLLGVPVAAHAQSDPIAGAVAGLKGHTVYVAPDSGQDITANEVQSLEAQIAKGRAAIFIAVLPEAAASQAGGVDGLPHTLAIAMGDPTAVFGVVSGRSFRAGAKAGAGLDSGEAGNFAKAAISAHSPASNRLVVALSDWVTRVDNRVATRPAGSSTGAAASKGSSTDWGKIILIIAAVLLVIPAIGLGVWLILRKRRDEAELARRRSVLKRRLEDLSGDVVNLEATVAINDNAKAAYSNAVTAYTSGNSRFSDTASDLELDDVEHYVEIAESAMSDAKEYAAGRDPHPPVKVTKARLREPVQTYAKADAPKAAPTQTTTVVNNYNGDSRDRWQGNYNGYGYGYYPGYGWGYYGNNGDFVAGMLAAEMMEDRREERYEREEREDRRDDEPSYSSSSSSSSSSSDSGSGDWGSSSSSPSYDPPSTDFGGGGDWGGGGGGDSGGGGGGGGDW